MRGIATLTSAVFLAGCGGGPPPRAPNDEIRITYFRFTEIKGKKYVQPEYWVLQSESWYTRRPDTPSFPMRRLVSAPFLGERIKDKTMKKLYAALMGENFEILPHTDPATIDLRALAELPRDRNVNKIRAHRFMTVESGDEKKVVLYASILDPTYTQARSVELNNAFIRSEIAFFKSEARANAIQVSRETAPFIPRDR